MRRSRRSISKGSKAAPEPEVVSLLDDEDDGGGGGEGGEGDVAGTNGSSAPAAEAAAAAAKPAAKPTASKKPAEKAVEYDGEYAFPNDEEEQQQQNDGSDSDWQQPPPKQQPKQRRRRKQQLDEDDDDIEEVQGLISQAISKRSSKRPAASGDASASAAATGAIEQQPQGKRAKTSSSSAAPACKAAAANAGRASSAASKQSTQTTLHSKGFGALCFSTSQPAAFGQASTQQTGCQGMSAAVGQQHSSAAAASQSAAAAAGAPSASAEAMAAADGSEQWVDKHEPTSPDELLVHKRKVSEVQAWLQVYLEARKAGCCPTRVLLVTGPPGCGKSVTLRVLAESMGFELTEWNAPVPTLWQDYQYQAGAAVGYSSKLDEFDLFVARCKFAALPLTCSSGSRIQQQQQQQQSQVLRPLQTQQEPLLSHSQELMPPPKWRLPQLFPSQQQSQQHLQSQQQQLQQQQQQQQVLSSQLPLQQASQQQPSSQKQQQASQQQRPQQQQQRPQARPKLLLVDDLPYVGDAGRRARLAASLGDLAATARCPVVVVATTEAGGSGGSKGSGYSSHGAAVSGMTSKGLHKDLLAVLEAAGATSINFNPITANTITKALQGIAAKEGFALDPDTADAIAQAAAGDLRNAIQSLQLLLLRQQPTAAQRGKRGKAKAPKRPRRAAKDPEAAAAAEAAKQQVAEQVARDQHLSVFHAVGKLLHYKRQQPGDLQQQGQSTGSQQQQPAGAAAGSSKLAKQQQEGGGDDSDVELIDAAASQQEQQQQQANSRLWRSPLRINPEAIIQDSGLEALQVTSLLAENYPHFIAEVAMEQVAAAATYLSDAGYLACYRSPVASSAGFWDEDDAAATTLQASAASSVAARGLLFANTQPAPSRWLPLKGPSCFLPERAAAGNLQRLAQAVQQLHDGLESEGPVRQQAALGLAAQLLHSGRQERAAQVLPYMQVLARAQGRLWLQGLLPRTWCHVWNGALSEGQGSGSGLQAPQVRAALAAAVGSALAERGAAGSGGGAGGQQHGAPAAGQAGIDGSAGVSDELDEIEDD